MTLAYDDAGQGKPVVLLHGFPLSRAMWRPQRDALPTSCRLLTPDLPGFGDSPLLGTTPTMETLADAVASWLDTLALGEPVILGGLSMGGYISLAFVRKYPDRLRGLILADTRSGADDDTGKANRDRLIGLASTGPASSVIEQMIPKLFGPDTQANKPDIIEEVRRLGAAQRPAGIIAALQAMRNRPDATPVLSGVRMPTLILVGQDDALTPPAMSEAMASQVPGARLVVLPGAGHMANLEAPTAFNDAVRAFVQRVP